MALYFTQKPPGMEAQTFPVSLPASGMLSQHADENITKMTLIRPLQDAYYVQRNQLHAQLSGCMWCLTGLLCGFTQDCFILVKRHHRAAQS